MPICNQILFCGCQTYTTMWYTDEHIPFIVFFYVTFIILATMVIVRTNIEWFIYKDYYPLKQRSPILCMILTSVIGMQIMFYPVLFICQYLTGQFIKTYIQTLFRSFQTSIEFTPYLIYFIRAMRIVYAHQTTVNHKNTFIFKLFKNQALLGILLGGISLMRCLPVLFGSNHFRLLVEYSYRMVSKQDEDQFLYHYFFSSFSMKLLLLYCLYLQKDVHPRYSMKTQLIFIIITEILTSIPILFFLEQSLKQQQNMFELMCYQSLRYPVIEIIKVVRLILLFFISIVIPLKNKTVYHKLLPTGRLYNFSKTMRDFLMEPEYLDIFAQFLKHLDSKEETNRYSGLLDFWKDLIIIRYKQEYSNEERYEKLRDSLEQYDQTDDQDNMIIQVKSSVDSLSSQIQGSGVQNETFQFEMNLKIIQLQRIVLKKLDAIYKDKYTKTRSFQQLARMISNNKNTNICMILLNMKLIIDSQNQQGQ